jgi:diguanylate cyclase (GGDEF)-like protein
MAVGNFLIGGRDILPGWLAVVTGGALLLLSVSAIWIAARVFNGRPVAIWVPLAGAAAWLVACAVPDFYANYDARVIAVSVVTVLYYVAAAREFAMRDGLLTRLPIVVVIAIHIGFILLRIPFVLTDDVAGFSFATAGWFGMATLEALVVIQLVAFLMVSLTKERVEARLRDAAHTDPLTGLGNRRAFFERGDAAIALAARNGSQFAVIAFDLDRFKDINDRHGHPVGDVVLQAFAAAARNRLRASDFVARLGGEEFAALLPDTDGHRAAVVALHINQAFQAAVADLPHPGLAGTASAGVAHLSPGLASLDALLSAADRALYEAKATGRGHVRLSEPAVAAVKAA